MTKQRTIERACFATLNDYATVMCLNTNVTKEPAFAGLYSMIMMSTRPNNFPPILVPATAHLPHPDYSLLPRLVQSVYADRAKIAQPSKRVNPAVTRVALDALL